VTDKAKPSRLLENEVLEVSSLGPPVHIVPGAYPDQTRSDRCLI
jgi:hypothetical protein